MKKAKALYVKVLAYIQRNLADCMANFYPKKIPKLNSKLVINANPAICPKIGRSSMGS